jgi:hypothetical protein
MPRSITIKVLRPSPYNLVSSRTGKGLVAVVAEARVILNVTGQINPNDLYAPRMDTCDAYPEMNEIHEWFIESFGEQGVAWTVGYFAYSRTMFDKEELLGHYHFTSLPQLSLFKLRWVD